MEISYNSLGPDTYLVKLNGALNARSAEDAKQTFRDLSDKSAKRVIVDLDGVPFIIRIFLLVFDTFSQA